VIGFRLAILRYGLWYTVFFHFIYSNTVACLVTNLWRESIIISFGTYGHVCFPQAKWILLWVVVRVRCRRIKFTFAISSPDEFLVFILRTYLSAMFHLPWIKITNINNNINKGSGYWWSMCRKLVLLSSSNFSHFIKSFSTDYVDFACSCWIQI